MKTYVNKVLSLSLLLSSYAFTASAHNEMVDELDKSTTKYSSIHKDENKSYNTFGIFGKHIAVNIFQQMEHLHSSKGFKKLDGLGVAEHVVGHSLIGAVQAAVELGSQIALRTVFSPECSRFASQFVPLFIAPSRTASFFKFGAYIADGGLKDMITCLSPF